MLRDVDGVSDVGDFAEDAADCINTHSGYVCMTSFGGLGKVVCFLTSGGDRWCYRPLGE